MTFRQDARGLGWNDLALFLLTCAIGVFAFWQSYQRWLDPIVDIGRDLYIPEQLTLGKELYRDFAYNYPPFAPYLLALIVKAAGSSLRVYMVTGMALALLTGAALYWLTRVTSSRIGAVVASIAFFSVNFTSGTSYNWLFPYSHAAVLGIMFLLIHLAATAHYLFLRRSRWLLMVALLSGLAASCSRVEIAVVVVAVALAGTVMYRLPMGYVTSLAASLAASAGAIHLYFKDASPSPWGQMSWLMAAEKARAFYSVVSGVADWKEHLVEILLGAMLITSITALLGFVDARIGVARIPWRWRLLAATAAFAVFLFLRLDIFFRGWALLQILLIPSALRERERSPLLLILIASLLASSRIFLNLTPFGYGFTLTLLLYPLIAQVVFTALPQRRIYSEAASLFWIPILLAVAAKGLFLQRDHYRMSVHPIVTGRGTFYDRHRDRAAVLNSYLPYMERRHASGMVVFPEGLTLNYFTRVPNPLRYYLFSPVESGDSRVEVEILRQLSRTRPEVIVVLTRPLGEYGSAGFGVDYNDAISRQIDRDYVVERAWRTRQFNLILRRRATDPAEVGQPSRSLGKGARTAQDDMGGAISSQPPRAHRR